MNYKKITLTFHLEQVCKDLLVQCNLVSKSVREAALADLKADLQTPDGDETRSLICRAVTEAFGQLKYAAQRYLTTGRTSDNNNLERLAHFKTPLKDYNDDGAIDYDDAMAAIIDQMDKKEGDAGFDPSMPGDFNGDGITDSADIIALQRNGFVVFEDIILSLRIPNFNVSVTDALKSWMHKYVVDYTMWRFLQDQLPERAGTYKTLAETDDYPRVTDCLNSRENFTMRTPSFI